MDFETLFSSFELNAQPCTGSVPITWSQGRTVFGGLSAALMLKHMYVQLNDPSRKLLSYSCNFVAPLIAAQPFSISTHILRNGKNVTQIESRIEQKGATCLVSLACFGTQRSSKVQVSSSCQPSILNQQIQPQQTINYIEGVFPAFIQHVDLNIQSGALPFSGANSTELHGWMKFKHSPQNTCPELYILALADAWPPTLLQLCDKPSPASSVSWYIEFLQPMKIEELNWLGYEAITHMANNGYGIEDAKIFSRTGELLALSRQTVAVFDS
ncbi:acyl-CoA thioesterase [Pseudoalteromonas luteoviolacea]|uniref:Acyl-CoA thioesterase n=1 Tax=Pseudoalteromonas luteoviolacea TaxID=43657 RepID=A0A0C1Q571_9GAMM|nr:thioesterase family protein [Pseudoalteromonas luteoviolacea]KID55731.1 acyl-CoA thioesterase [Pseudoalteromonas luteoviolacea]